MRAQNLLFILSDEHNRDITGCYGKPASQDAAPRCARGPRHTLSLGLLHHSAIGRSCSISKRDLGTSADHARMRAEPEAERRRIVDRMRSTHARFADQQR